MGRRERVAAAQWKRESGGDEPGTLLAGREPGIGRSSSRPLETGGSRAQAGPGGIVRPVHGPLRREGLVGRAVAARGCDAQGVVQAGSTRRRCLAKRREVKSDIGQSAERRGRAANRARAPADAIAPCLFTRVVKKSGTDSKPMPPRRLGMNREGLPAWPFSAGGAE